MTDSTSDGPPRLYVDHCDLVYAHENFCEDLWFGEPFAGTAVDDLTSSVLSTWGGGITTGSQEQLDPCCIEDLDMKVHGQFEKYVMPDYLLFSGGHTMRDARLGGDFNLGAHQDLLVRISTLRVPHLHRFLQLAGRSSLSARRKGTAVCVGCASVWKTWKLSYFRSRKAPATPSR